MIKIGITEQGDAALDLSWQERLDDVAFAILITKAPQNLEFLKAVENHKDKVMIHATVTGFGESILEKHVKKSEIVLQAIPKLQMILGTPDKVVLRIDPVVPTEKGITLVIPIIEKGIELGVTRIRYSFIDMYRHVRDRFKDKNISLPFETFQAPEEMQQAFLDAIKPYRNKVCFESCTETNSDLLGCVSNKDAKIFGVTERLAGRHGQRKECPCLFGKTELLKNPKRCENKCLYCYWRG